MSLLSTRETAAANAIGRLAGCAAPDLVRLGGGRNSQVYLVSTADGRYVAKVYYRASDDPRDRLGAEKRALTFLADHGIGDVPAIVAHDDEAGVLLLEHIDGSPPDPAELTTSDADALTDFAARLHGLVPSAADPAIGPASEACFTQSDLVRAIERRVERLAAVPPDTPHAPALRTLLDTRLAPAFERHRQPSAAAAALDRAHWTLSPSDFGFHNAIRRPDGRLAFVDFEYFGWDDPAKMTADVLLHPGSAPPPGVRERISRRLQALFGATPGFEARLAVIFPLCAINWALILLNEFVPAHAGRRGFAGDADLAATRARQLARAEAFLCHV